MQTRSRVGGQNEARSTYNRNWSLTTAVTSSGQLRYPPRSRPPRTALYQNSLLPYKTLQALCQQLVVIVARPLGDPRLLLRPQSRESAAGMPRHPPISLPSASTPCATSCAASTRPGCRAVAAAEVRGDEVILVAERAAAVLPSGRRGHAAAPAGEALRRRLGSLGCGQRSRLNLVASASASASASSALSASRTSLAAAPRSGCSRSLAASGLTPRLGSATRSARTATRRAADGMREDERQRVVVAVGTRSSRGDNTRLTRHG